MSQTISVEKLVKRYGQFTAVDELSFQVEEGQVFGLLGHNGAGKSTTLECMLGVKKKDGGNVSILGMDAVKDRKNLFQHVGVQFQHSCFPDKMKVWELCEENQALYHHPQPYAKLLEEFGIDQMKKRFISDLSGGERQKLSIVLALLPNPKVVVLDELTTGLDAAARRDVWKQLSKLKHTGITVLLTSHYMNEVEALCDKVLLLKSGRVAAEGELKKVIDESPYTTMEEAYLWYMGEELA